MLCNAANICLNMLNTKHFATADSCRGVYETQSNTYNGGFFAKMSMVLTCLEPIKPLISEQNKQILIHSRQ